MQATLGKLTPSFSRKLNFFFDIVAISGAWHLAVSPDNPMRLALLLAMVSGWIFATAVLRLYSPTSPRRRIDSMMLVGIAVVSVSTGAWLLHQLYGGAGFEVFLFAKLVGVSVVASNLLCSALLAFEPPRESVLIVGSGPLGRATYDRLQRLQEQRRHVVGFVRFPHEDEKPENLPAPLLGSTDELWKLLETSPVTELYIAARVLEHGDEMQHIVRACEEVGMPFALPLHSLRFDRAHLLSSSAGRDGYLHYVTTQSVPWQLAVKRLFDIAASLTALIVLSPLFLGVALGIKLTSRGPIFFKQLRVGLHGSSFHMFKFRSMVVNAEALKAKLAAQNEQTGPVFKMKNDPRVTAIGRFIRKYSIDELPQLINILRGDMSVVGPRPAVPSEVAQYRAWQRRRLSVRPGLTCHWQVSGRNEIGFEEWMRLDLTYVDHWDLATDMRLILRTFPVVLTGKGAS